MDNDTTIWWREYRRSNYRPRGRNMNFEMVLRSTMLKTFKEYVENSSLSGFKKIFEPNVHILIRLTRSGIFIFMFGSIFYFLQYLWFDNLAKPLIVTMDSSTYPISKIDFPAITLCNFNRISKKAVQRYIDKNYKDLAPHNESKSDVEWFFTQLGRFLDYSYNESVQAHPLFFPFERHIGDSHNIIPLMKKLAPSCEESLLRCSWSGNIVDCSSIFSIHQTVRGHCCTFNRVLGFDTSDKLDSPIYTVKRQHEPGQLHGLNVILDSMVDDYSYTLYNMFGFEVLIFDPTHFADPTGGRVIQRIAQPAQAAFFELHTIKQVATKEVRKYPVKTRKCLFRDEMKDSFDDLYSYSSCIIKCRIRTVQSLCKCTPYFFPYPRRDQPICSFDNLRCLNKYREKLLYLFPKDAANTDGLETEVQDSLFCDECLPDCELTQHFTKHSKIPLSYAVNRDKDFANFFLNDLNMANKTLLCIYQATTDGVLNRLDTVFYWYEIVSNIGGFCGILIGFSIIGVLELVFYFVFRFAYNLYIFYYE